MTLDLTPVQTALADLQKDHLAQMGSVQSSLDSMTDVAQAATQALAAADTVVTNLTETLRRSRLRPDLYVVQSGDNLTRIADRFGVTVELIKDWNKKEDDLILVDEELWLFPTEAEPVPAPVPTTQFSFN